MNRKTMENRRGELRKLDPTVNPLFLRAGSFLPCCPSVPGKPARRSPPFPGYKENRNSGSAVWQVQCETCVGSGEIITDWGRYLHGYASDGDCSDAVAPCPDCDGSGYVDEDPECTDCGGSGIAFQTERICTCKPWPSDGTCRQCGAVPRSPTSGLCATCEDESRDPTPSEIGRAG